MQPLKPFTATFAVMPMENIDTDQIIPARFLKTTSKQGLGENLFADWRFDAEGSPRQLDHLHRLWPVGRQHSRHGGGRDGSRREYPAGGQRRFVCGGCRWWRSHIAGHGHRDVQFYRYLQRFLDTGQSRRTPVCGGAGYGTVPRSGQRHCHARVARHRAAVSGAALDCGHARRRTECTRAHGGPREHRLRRAKHRHRHFHGGCVHPSDRDRGSGRR